MQRSTTSADEFLASLPEDSREAMVALDREIAAVMKDSERVLWEGRFWGGSDQRIIGYGTYSYKGRSGAQGEWFVCGLAQQKNYITVFVNGVTEGGYLAESYAKRLGKVKVGRSTVSFKQLADVDLKELLVLVTEARDQFAAQAS